jgi:hypothetical protein
LGISSPNAPLHKTGDPYYSSIRAGVATFTELQQGDDIVSYPAVPVALTDDVYSEFGAFRTGWAQAHFLGSLYGGADLQDSPFSALKLALQQDWRDDSRHVIVLFSNSWGKDKEPVTDLTMKQITALARDKNVEILPVFTSRTLRANPDRAQFVNDANLFYAKLATQTEGHRTEVTDLITSSLVYDVIMGHVFSPDVVISKGATYANPKTKKATTTDLKNTKTVVKKGANIVLSASKSSSPTGKIIKYSWDFNGDGIIDYESDGPFAENDYTGDYDGLVCVTVTDNLGQSTTSCEQIATTDDNDQVTDEEPAVLQAPEFHVVRSGSNAIITWQPTDGYIVFRDSEGALIVVTDAHNGLFTLKDVPSERFVLTGQLVDGNNESEPRIITIAVGEVQAIPAAPTDSNQTTEPSPAPPDTASDNGDGLVLETGSDAPTRQTVVLGSVQEMSDKVTLPTVAGTEGLSPASTGNSQSPRNGVSALWHAFAAKAAKIVEGIAEDYLLLLLVVLLLLIWYYLKSRRRDQETYQYDQQKRYTSRKVISLQT